jgi:hypothetical protein
MCQRNPFPWHNIRFAEMLIEKFHRYIIKLVDVSSFWLYCTRNCLLTDAVVMDFIWISWYFEILERKEKLTTKRKRYVNYFSLYKFKYRYVSYFFVKCPLVFAEQKHTFKKLIFCSRFSHGATNIHYVIIREL